MDYERSLDDVVDALKKAKSKNVNVNLLIGAGCSAGIPTAEGVLKKIKEEYPREYERAVPKDYSNVMSKLTPQERRTFIMELVSNSKINWAHVAIAQLLKHNYIDRILTTNFDNLLQRAFSLVGEFPAIYDLATSKDFRTDLLFDKSIIHLHGQYTGFILCNTEKEVIEQAKLIRPVFEELNKNSLWIVVGYSGNNDPVFELLTEREIYEYRLFWVGYHQNEPNEQLKTNLLSEEKYAYYIKGHDADTFFVRLSQKLNCFPPNFIHKPFSYLSNTIDMLAPYKNPLPTLEYLSGPQFEYINLSTKKVIEKAISTIETDRTLMAEHFLLAGMPEEVIKLDHVDENEEELEIHLITAYIAVGGLENVLTAFQKVNKLIKSHPDNYAYPLMLPIIHLHLFVSEENFELDHFTKSCEQFSISMMRNPSVELFQLWQYFVSYFIKGYYVNDLLTNSITKQDFEKIVSDFFNELERYYSLLVNDPEIENNKFYDNDAVYLPITNGDFALAKNILDMYKRQIHLVKASNKPFLEANLGLWFLRNNEIETNLAEVKGVAHYKESIKLITETKLDNSHIIEAFKQKYFVEYARFCLERKNDTNRAMISIENALAFGNIDGFPHILEEVFAIRKLINSQTRLELPTAGEQ